MIFCLKKLKFLINFSKKKKKPVNKNKNYNQNITSWVSKKRKGCAVSKMVLSMRIRLID